MRKLFLRLGLAHRLAALCGALCLVASLALVGVSSLSSRYILQQQQAIFAQQLAGRIAAETATVLGRADLISLEVTLERLISENQLLGLAVYDVEGRQIGAAGVENDSSSESFLAPVTLAGNLAGEVRIFLPPSPALLEQQRMALGLLLLAVLLSVFATATAANWGQKIVVRLRRVIQKLQLDSTADGANEGGDELESLEQTIEQLPVELLKPGTGTVTRIANYEAAGLLYIRLNSLAHYAETLDEASLLRHTQFQHTLIKSAAELYQGEVSVVRQFGLLINFAGSHNSGSPVFRAASTAWTIQELAASLQGQVSLKLSMSMSCGLSEAGAANCGDTYSELYCQHLIDELAELVTDEPAEILLSEAACRDETMLNTCHLAAIAGRKASSLSGFTEPTINLLQRQQTLLRRQLENAA